MKSSMKSHPLLSLAYSSLVELPSPAAISAWWNFGSLLGLCLISQILTGLFLSMHYSCDISTAFESVNHIMRDVNFGWEIRSMHANGASFFFMCIYSHMGRGIYYGSFSMGPVWMIGVTLLLLLMATAFFGYVLPWGQMSFWGATVITNLFSAIPFIGQDLVFWMWGGFAVDNATLTRFFSLHFILPFVLAAFSMIHLVFLHESGSGNPLGLNSNLDKIPFHPYFSNKDVFGFFLFFMLGMLLNFQAPWMLGDPENFIPANPLVTPVHIQPEWYFLFAYAILRSIPNKLGGVIALACSVVVFYFFPLFKTKKFNSLKFYPLSKLMFWMFIMLFFLLTWIGARPVEEPYVLVGQILTLLYFLYFLSFPYMKLIEEKLVNL